MRRKSNDIFLLLAIGALMALALIPAQKEENEDKVDRDPVSIPNPSHAPEVLPGEVVEEVVVAADDNASVPGAFHKVEEAVRALEKHNEALRATLRQPSPRGNAVEIQSVDLTLNQQVFPINAGNEWIYRVTGPKELVPDDTWTMRIVSEPDGNAPGLVEMGFGRQRFFETIHRRGGSVLFEGFPFFEPRELVDMRPSAIDGELVPDLVRIIDGAVWYKTSTRDILYKYTDDKGVSHSQKARASQKDRALVSRFETQVVPAGKYGAHRIEWISRISIQSKGRVVLGHLTTEPYRKETMWLAPGIGIVSRNIVYLERERSVDQIQFDLLAFNPGEDCVFHDLEVSH